MKVINIHECRLEASVSTIGALLDTLATAEDRLWPYDDWPAMHFDRPLAVGAAGGHGPISYSVESYQPGHSIKFLFTDPPGFDGHHWLEVQPDSQQGSILRHTIHMKVTGRALVSWLLIIRPLHDALLEDALSRVRLAVGMPARRRPWSLWVRFLRWIRYRQPVS